MMTLASLCQFVERGHVVTVIAPSPHHYYSGMGPGMLGGTYSPEQVRFKTQHVVEKQGGRFILGKVVRVTPGEKSITLASGDTVPYDILSCNTGSYASTDQLEIESSRVYPVKPIEQLSHAGQDLKTLMARGKLKVGILGGGPSAAELAGNIWQLGQQTEHSSPAIRIYAGTTFMKRFPPAVRRRVERVLANRGIDIDTGGYARTVMDGRIILDTGKTFAADVIFLALGVKPSPVFKNSGLTTGPDGGLLVNRYLQAVDHPHIFGGGDCIYFRDNPLDKVGVYAVRQNPVLRHNLLAALEGRDYRPFDPGGDYLLVFNLGGGVGDLRKNRFTISGRTAFFIKDYIDRKFMRRFQAVETSGP
jgi:NADH dehydrogenase FAD-containing subunit